ncbi:hypothetical protein ACFLYU_00235 [Candidatus Dependentiae bacterium]
MKELKPYKLFLILLNFVCYFYGARLLAFSKDDVLYKGNTSAITYKLGGRLGDQLITYIKAKWLSYKYNIPLYFSFSKYLGELKISKIDLEFNEEIKRKFNKVLYLKIAGSRLRNSKYGYGGRSQSKFNMIEPEANVLYVSNHYANVNIDWNDKNFIKELKRTICPIEKIDKPEIPESCISVAVHVRKGGGIDLPLCLKQYADKLWPLKFPPDEYYIVQIRKLYKMLNKSSLHVHIFTDDRNPKRIVEKYKKELNIGNITFSCREKGNSHGKNVVEDLILMTYYDCQIRSLSNFAIIPDIIGDFFVVIYPEHGYWRNNKLIIDKVKVRINRDCCDFTLIGDH